MRRHGSGTGAEGQGRGPPPDLKPTSEWRKRIGGLGPNPAAGSVLAFPKANVEITPSLLRTRGMLGCVAPAAGSEDQILRWYRRPYGGCIPCLLVAGG
jgi:hypothetical protein